MLRAVALALTFLTGISGLVYQVTWERYLAVLLGSHAEATAAVLGIFLGGLAGGYALFGALSKRRLARAEAGGPPAALLELYGFAEIGIGAIALSFPVLFGIARAVSVALPPLGDGAGFAADVMLCAVLLLPPTVLMGGTIPLLTQSLARAASDATRVHALVYGLNTAGAFVGTLLAGFWLISALGLPGTLYATAGINLAAGAIFIWMGPRAQHVASPAEPSETAALAFPAYAAAALLAGFATMTLEVVAIRIGALTLGSSEYSFAMVVAAFVLCIAIGSLFVTALSRVPGWLLIGNQLALVAVATAAYPAIPRLPILAQQLRTGFSLADTGFPLFFTAAFLGALALMAPLLLLSGASLPLIFDHLRRRHGELGSIAGRLYSWNTLGSLLGALLGGYALLFWLDLHHVYRIAVAALALGAAALAIARVREGGGARLATAVGVVLLPLVALLANHAPWSPELMSSGLFRERTTLAHSEEGADAALAKLFAGRKTVFYDDDPSATVSVAEYQGPKKLVRGLHVNGKPDSATERDLQTTVLLGILPALFAAEPKRAFVIGYGTGVSAGELAELRSIDEVVVGEISRGVTLAAPLFDFANHGASKHPKIRISRSDAYRALQRSEGTFDVIASEPSNPWVSGVEMLYSREFLEAARAKLTPGGVFCQWFHQYEVDDESLGIVLRTFDSVFEHAAIWYGASPDLLVLGFQDPRAAEDLARLVKRARQPDYSAALLRAELDGVAALFAHELWPVGVLRALAPRGEIQTLLRPRLSHVAGRAFFRNDVAQLPFTGAGEAALSGKRNALLPRFLASLPDAARPRAQLLAIRESCRHRQSLCIPLLAGFEPTGTEAARLEQAVRAIAERPSEEGVPVDAPSLRAAANFLSASPAAGELGRLAAAQLSQETELYRATYHHAAPYHPESLRARWERCVGKPAACEEGRQRALALLGAAPVQPEEGVE
jgi:spermidine synthase